MAATAWSRCFPQWYRTTGTCGDLSYMFLTENSTSATLAAGGTSGTVVVHVCLITVTSRGTGGTVVAHVGVTTVTWARFLPRAVILLKLPWLHVRRVLFSLTLPSMAGFLRVLRFPPVVTLDPKGVTLTGPLGRTA